MHGIVKVKVNTNVLVVANVNVNVTDMSFLPFIPPAHQEYVIKVPEIYNQILIFDSANT